MLKSIKILLLVILIFVVTGCQSNTETKPDQINTEPKEKEVMPDNNNSNDNSNSNENDNQEQEVDNGIDQDIPKLPATISEIIEYPAGELASEFDDDKFTSLMENKSFVNEKDEVQLFTYLYSLFKMNYNDPKMLMNTTGIGKGPSKGDTPKELQAENFNVEIILDASGSMANRIGSKTRMDLAKEAIKNFTASLPKNANVGLRVYGHKGSGSDQDKEMSCKANELVYPLQPFNDSNFSQSLNKFNPAGWTAMAESLKLAQKDLAKFKGKQNRNIIYLVSDGIETCNGDPIAASKSLKASSINPVIHIVGFDVPGSEEKQLMDMAKAAGGTYANVKNQQQLNGEFKKTAEESYKWMNWYTKNNSSAITHLVEQQRKIIDLINGWRSNTNQEYSNLLRAIVELNNRKKITDEQEAQLEAQLESFYKMQRKLVDEVFDTFMALSEKNYEDTKNKIDEIYNKNSSSEK
ncbi:vWA domain-containing protein [Heyndrickxia sp. NPDC080065]|uniref:vWA domain-containing protein n=1 Tax=Heyndrickxia sp. NPDC080065 TaxID=3390568 RepID=UPI003D01B1C2